MDYSRSYPWLRHKRSKTVAKNNTLKICCTITMQVNVKVTSNVNI